MIIRNKETGEMYDLDIPMFKVEGIESMLDEQWEVIDK